MHCLSTDAVMFFNWLLCKLLMLHQVANIMQVPSLLPKTSVRLKEIQKVLDLTELKIVKPSDTCWLAHEQ